MFHKSLLIALLLIASAATAQTTKPARKMSAAAVAALELRATQTFNKGDYAAAMPLLQQLAAAMADQPDRLGLVQEELRVCRSKLSVASVDPQAALSAPSVATPPPTAEARKAHPAPKDGDVTELAIKELGNFEYDAQKGGNIPADVIRLSGHRIRTRGFMLPLDQADAITRFALVPSLFGCCQYGQPPQIQHTIVIDCPKGKAVSYYPDEIAVEGTLKVEEKKDDGFIVSIFEMEASSVRPVAK